MPPVRRVLVGAAVVVVILVVAGMATRYAAKHHEPDAKPLPGAALKTRAGDRYLGTAVDDQALQNGGGYTDDLGAEFSAVTPENVMKWAVVEPKDGTTDYGPGDRLVDFAAAHDQRVRGHTLVWYSQNPPWFMALHGDELKAKLQRHVDGVVRHFAGKVDDWDVVNEPMADNGGLRQWLVEKQMGPSYVQDAFTWAHAADPKAHLWLNETAAESVGPKSDGLYKLVKSLLAAHVPLYGVGFQGHFDEADGVPPTFRANLQRFAALGIKVAITELDVAIKLPATDAKLAHQARIYADAVGDCRAVSACAGITVWGFTDRHSWIPATQPGYGAATLLNDDLAPKPAYRRFARALSSGQ